MLTVRGSNIPLAPQALAELEPIIPQGYYYPEHMGMELEYRYALYGEIYLHQPWVNAVIRKRADAIARLPVNVWDVNSDGTRDLDTQSQYAALLADPCSKMHPYEFWHWLQTTLDIYGETYLVIVRKDPGDNTSQPIDLLPMHPSRVAIRRDPEDGTYTYFFQAGSGINTELVSFPETNIVPFKMFNPSRLERGMSKMEALRSTIFAEDSSRTATSAMWRNAGRPNVVLESVKALGDIGRKKLRAEFDGAHAGSGNVGKTLVLEDGVTAKAMQITALDMQYIESRQLNREEVCGVYDVAPPIVHILDRATFSNISAQMRAFYRDTMAPPIEFIQSAIDKYVGSNWTRKNIMRFAVDEVIRGDYEVRVEAAHKGVATAVLTPNEARELIGLNKYNDPKADELWANSAIQRLGEPGETLRMSESAVGVTPDGIRLALATTPVASLDNGKPTSVPARHPAPQAPQPGGAVAQPNTSNPSTHSSKYLRQIKGEVGRGRSTAELKEFAKALAQKAESEDELKDILWAVQTAVADRKATTE